MALIALLSYEAPVFADIKLTGYASIVAGRVTNGEQFLADYPKAGVYDDDWSFSPDTSFGVQLSSDLSEKIKLIIQAISNGASNYDVELDWAYLNYQLSTEISLQAGRKRLPLYYYSDFFDVGYAYYWIRPPADNYTWQISNYNGLSLLYQPQLREWDALFNIYIGREDSDNNDLLSMLADASVDETWKNMVGFVAELSNDWIDIRTAFMRGQLDRTIDDVIAEKDIKQKFSGLSVNLHIDNISILSEFNQYIRDSNNIDVKTHMLSIAYRIDKLTPHLTHSALKQGNNLAGGDENHETKSAGFKWDFNKTTALKIQYDKVKDKGIIIPVLGDSKSISFGIDVVF